jgi:peptidoglycan/LPS O-acetylase OafA/YrhL
MDAMFGSLRLFLAFFVVFSHLVGTHYLQHFGFYAVRGFYVLSGFLMTAGLNDLYAFNARRYFTNRFLRLMPLYFVVYLLTLIAVVWLPTEAATFIGQWQPDLLWRDAITNVLVLPLHHPEPHYRLIPTAWSLAVEIEMYVVLFLFVSRSIQHAMVALFFGLLYHAVCGFYHLSFDYRYFGLPSALLAFSLGALIYFYRKRGLLLDVTPTIAVAALGIWVVDALVPQMSFIESAGYYTDTVLFAVVVTGLANAKGGPLAKSLDRALGEIAYPVFLVQWLTGFVTALVFLPGTWRGWSLALASIPVTLAASVVLALLNQKIIEPLRERIRHTPAYRPLVVDAQPHREYGAPVGLPVPAMLGVLEQDDATALSGVRAQ